MRPITQSIETTTRSVTTRVSSIDIFRGLTMMVMIFVNDLAGVTGLPWWTYHAHEEQDLMTYVDMVFPFFLFIVGMSMPLAVESRLKKNASHLSLWLHIGARSLGLVVLGLILANAEKGDPARMHMPIAAWALLALTGATFTWLVPSRDVRYARIYKWLRIIGIILVITAFAIFRRTASKGSAAWIDASYLEILGIIGFTYFAVALLYVPTRRWLWAPLGWFIALTTFCALTTARVLHVPWNLPFYLWPFGAGDSASITMAGIVTSVIFIGRHRWQALQQKMLLGSAFAIASFLAAWLFAPLGISKIRATPTWCLASVGASVLVFMFLYWLCDVKAKTRWAFLVKPAGENTLLTYLLPDIYYYLALLCGFTYFDRNFNSGAAGVASATLFTIVILVFSAFLTRKRVRLQL